MPQAGEVFNPADVPRRIGLIQGIADLTATSGTTEKTIDTFTVSLVTGRSYTIRYVFHYTMTTGAIGDAYYVRIRQGALAGAQITYANADITMPAGFVGTRVAECTFVATSTGDQQFTTTVQRSSGSGTCTIKGSASQPRELSARFEG